jgi:hypothetical protein
MYAFGGRRIVTRGADVGRPARLGQGRIGIFVRGAMFSFIEKKTIVFISILFSVKGSIISSQKKNNYNGSQTIPL